VKPYRLLVEWGVVVRIRELPPGSQWAIYSVFRASLESNFRFDDLRLRTAAPQILEVCPTVP
jgi:hypothetical protein